jgi:ribosomal protein S18 acetylase RimI-like enzyme
LGVCDLDIRIGTDEDAEIMASCIVDASGGIVECLLEGVFPGLRVEEALELVLRSGDCQFSPGNAVFVRSEEKVIGLVFSYSASFQGVPALAGEFLPSSRIEPLREILTAVVPGSLYINTLWVAERWRGGGVADVLMDSAAMRAAEEGLHGISLHVWCDNIRARSFYARQGFREHCRLAVPCPLADRHPDGSLILYREI